MILRLQLRRPRNAGRGWGLAPSVAPKLTEAQYVEFWDHGDKHLQTKVDLTVQPLANKWWNQPHQQNYLHSSSTSVSTQDSDSVFSFHPGCLLGCQKNLHQPGVRDVFYQEIPWLTILLIDKPEAKYDSVSFQAWANKIVFIFLRSSWWGSLSTLGSGRTLQTRNIKLAPTPPERDIERFENSRGWCQKTSDLVFHSKRHVYFCI